MVLFEEWTQNGFKTGNRKLMGKRRKGTEQILAQRKNRKKKEDKNEKNKER